MTSEELLKLRKSTGLTQQQFGVIVLGVTGETVGRWEREEYKISDLMAVGIRTQVANYLETKPEKNGSSDGNA